MIVEEGHIALKVEMKFATRKYRAPYGLEELEMRQDQKRLGEAGPLYVALTEYKKLDPVTTSPLEGVERLPEQIQPEREERDYGGGLQGGVMEHGGENRGICLDGHRTR